MNYEGDDVKHKNPDYQIKYGAAPTYGPIKSETERRLLEGLDMIEGEDEPQGWALHWDGQALFAIQSAKRASGSTLAHPPNPEY
jgi:hypothetical protein